MDELQRFALHILSLIRHHEGKHPESSGSPLQNDSLPGSNLVQLIHPHLHFCEIGEKMESLKESHSDKVRTNETLHERSVSDFRLREVNCTD